METFRFTNENDFCHSVWKDTRKINTIYGEIKKEVTDYLNTVNIMNNTNNTIQIKSENKIVMSNKDSNHFIIESDELPKGLTLSSLD